MTLKDKITNDMKTALLGGNRFEGNVLRNLRASILDEEVNKNRRDDGLDDSEIEKIITREVKKRNESILIFEKNDRMDLVESEKSEVAILSTYLPEQLSESEVRDLVKVVMKDIDVSSPSAMGQIIGQVKKQAGNTADGAMVAKIVKEILNK